MSKQARTLHTQFYLRHFMLVLLVFSRYPRDIGICRLVNLLQTHKCLPWSKIQILNGVSSSKFSLNSELRNAHCSALPSHVCLYKTWWKYWKVSMRNPIETDFDVSLVSWFLTLKPDWPTKIEQYGFLKQTVPLKPINNWLILIDICQELFSFKKI